MSDDDALALIDELLNPWNTGQKVYPGCEAVDADYQRADRVAVWNERRRALASLHPSETLRPPTGDAFRSAHHALSTWHDRRHEALRLLRDWETADALGTVKEWVEQIIGVLDAPVVAPSETDGGEHR